MDLNTTKDTFDRVAKKQKLSSSKSCEAIDRVGHEIEHALSKLLSSSPVDLKSVLTDLKNELSAISPLNQLDGSHKDVNTNLSKYQKLLDKLFIPDISRAYRNVEFDPHTVNQIIVNHFYRHGLFDLGDTLIAEAGEDPDTATTFRTQFMEMHQILDALHARNLEPALTWVCVNRAQLEQNGSHLELNLHRLQFIEILQKGTRADALDYVRRHLASFAPSHMDEIQKLMACLLWTGRLGSSPYAELTATSHWERLWEEVVREYCGILGHSWESPLRVVVGAGAEGLPTLVKLAGVMAGKREEWEGMKQLPVAVDLGREFQFHSVFVCPVSREQASEENPGMLLPCGHVLCRQSIVKLSKGSTRTFKCPYCPADASVGQCKQLYF